MTPEYLRCPYCSEGVIGGHTKAVPKTIGRYRIKLVSDYVMVLQCQKCMKTFRISKIGKMLLWDDMTQEEKKAFTIKVRRKIK